MIQKQHRHDWSIGITSVAVVVAALVGKSEFVAFHESHFRKDLVGWIGAVVIVVAGVLATRRLANGLGGVLARSSIGAAGSGAGLRLLLLIVGYLIVIFSVFAVLGVSLTHLLLGAGLAGIILGIAAQQSLGNIFASLVLLVARPFVVGDRIRIRSGVLAGPLDATVLAIDLAYVTVQTDDGVLKIPNAVMLGSGIGKPNADTPPATS